MRCLIEIYNLIKCMHTFVTYFTSTYIYSLNVSIIVLLLDIKHNLALGR